MLLRDAVPTQSGFGGLARPATEVPASSLQPDRLPPERQHLQRARAREANLNLSERPSSPPNVGERPGCGVRSYPARHGYAMTRHDLVPRVTGRALDACLTPTIAVRHEELCEL